MIDTPYYNIVEPLYCLTPILCYAWRKQTEGVGFEPTVPLDSFFGTPVYQTGALSHSANLPPDIAVGTQKRSAATAMQFRTATQTPKAFSFSGRRAAYLYLTEGCTLRAAAQGRRISAAQSNPALRFALSQTTARRFPKKKSPHGMLYAAYTGFVVWPLRALVARAV